MSIEVLLMTDVTDLGSEGDVVVAADGYARNYLFPKKLAAPVSGETRKRLEKIRREREEVREAELAVAREYAAKFKDVSCTIPVKVSKDEKLFGSVTNVNIAEALKSQGFEEIEKHKILLDSPIKELGVFDVKISLHPDVETTVKVWIVEE
ncbi:50S ribosomal protein L9 [Verrucomicrobiota bacterium]